MKKPENEVERWVTNYLCPDCDGPIVKIRGEFSCSAACDCRQNIFYFWCDRCGEEPDVVVEKPEEITPA